MPDLLPLLPFFLLLLLLLGLLLLPLLPLLLLLLLLLLSRVPVASVWCTRALDAPACAAPALENAPSSRRATMNTHKLQLLFNPTQPWRRLVTLLQLSAPR